MAALQDGMKSLLPAIVAGNWETIAAIGGQLRDSFILQQELTPDLAADLHREVPAAFLELDRSFHHAADMLVHAADKGNRERVSFYL